MVVKLDPTIPLMYSWSKRGDLVSWPLALQLVTVDEQQPQPQPVGIAYYQRLDDRTNEIYYWCAELQRTFKLRPKQKEVPHDE